MCETSCIVRVFFRLFFVFTMEVRVFCVFMESFCDVGFMGSDCLNVVFLLMLLAFGEW